MKFLFAPTASAHLRWMWIPLPNTLQITTFHQAAFKLRMQYPYQKKGNSTIRVHSLIILGGHGATIVDGAVSVCVHSVASLIRW